MESLRSMRDIAKRNSVGIQITHLSTNTHLTPQKCMAPGKGPCSSAQQSKTSHWSPTVSPKQRGAKIEQQNISAKSGSRAEASETWPFRVIPKQQAWGSSMSLAWEVGSPEPPPCRGLERELDAPEGCAGETVCLTSWAPGDLFLMPSLQPLIAEPHHSHLKSPITHLQIASMLLMLFRAHRWPHDH